VSGSSGDGSAGVAGSISGSGGVAGATSGMAGSSGTAADGGTATGDSGEGGSGGEAGEAAGGGVAGEAGELAGGAGGEAGGEGGHGGAPECVSDGDCDDHVFCNGAEVCDDGRCQAGERFSCGNPDVEHCSVRCEEGETAAVCVVEGRDSDADGFVTKLCAADPGDDCNDAADEVHPDMTERCDGVDNDCDGLVDTEDGLPLAGTNSGPVADVYSLDAAWSPEQEAFKVVFDRSPAAEGVFMATLRNGSFTDTATTISPLASVDYFWPHLAWGGSSFGVSWTTYLPTGLFSVVMANADAGGIAAPASARRSINGVSNDIAARSDGQFVVTSTESEDLRVTRLTTGGAAEHGPSIALRVQHPHIATHGNEAVVVWYDSDAGDVFFRRVDAELKPLGTVPVVLQKDASFAEISGTPDGYAMAWHANAGLLGFKRVRADGSWVCTRNDIDLDITPDGSEHLSVADTQYGTLVLFTSNAGKVRLFRFDADCALTGDFTVAQTPSRQFPVVAVGGGRVALAWIDNSLNAYTREFGERLCE
jgi:hypothetical protein